MNSLLFYMELLRLLRDQLMHKHDHKQDGKQRSACLMYDAQGRNAVNLHHHDAVIKATP